MLPAARCRLLCRFLDAGTTTPSTCCGGRRPKSAKARSRGKLEAVVPRARSAMLILGFSDCAASVVRALSDWLSKRPEIPYMQVARSTYVLRVLSELTEIQACSEIHALSQEDYLRPVFAEVERDPVSYAAALGPIQVTEAVEYNVFEAAISVLRCGGFHKAFLERIYASIG
jgi:hypothetical protein